MVFMALGPSHRHETGGSGQSGRAPCPSPATSRSAGWPHSRTASRSACSGNPKRPRKWGRESPGRPGSGQARPPSSPPPLRPQHFHLLAQPRKFRVDSPRPCHDYNVPAARCPLQQRPDELTQAPLDSVADHGVSQLPADGQADSGSTKLIIAYEEGKVVGGGPATGAQGAVEVGRTDQPRLSLHPAPEGGLPVAPAGGWRQATAAFETAGLDHLDAAGGRHPGAEAMDLDPLALLRLMGTLHSNLNVFRRLTIPCRLRRSYVISDCAGRGRLLLFRCPGELRQLTSTAYAHEAGETSIELSTVVGSLCISSVPADTVHGPRFRLRGLTRRTGSALH